MKHFKGINLLRLMVLSWKEALQTVRDPSAIINTFVLPVIMLFLYSYAVSLDIREVPIGLVQESDSNAAQSLAAAFSGTPYFKVMPARDRREVADFITSADLKACVVIPQDFEKRLRNRTGEPLIQVLTDGSQPNTASFVAAYTEGVVLNWMQASSEMPAPAISLVPRVWFNPEVESRRFLVPGSIAIIMTIIGTLLTALVMAREWERGTMEALFSTPARITEILLGKLLPYFVLGLIATLGSALLAIYLFGVPMRGSWFCLIALSSAFLVPALGQGLVISVISKNQFIASQVSGLSSFLPALLLSGFLFEIDSMPWIIQKITWIIPARYFVSSLQTLFLVGDLWSVMIPNMLAMLAIGFVLFAIARKKTRKSLDV
ncbi:ABC transporter permease [Desulfococcaceae bacterium OttesenSCG-928-F15]|nr:ABC transporter permease [Desulfococcaceae bacterium OttesenSCG-928-F15]